jgi:hypothetical protein
VVDTKTSGCTHPVHQVPVADLFALLSRFCPLVHRVVLTWARVLALGIETLLDFDYSVAPPGNGLNRSILTTDLSAARLEKVPETMGL